MAGAVCAAPAMALKRVPEPEGSSARKLSTTHDRPHRRTPVLTAAFTRQGRRRFYLKNQHRASGFES